MFAESVLAVCCRDARQCTNQFEHIVLESIGFDQTTMANVSETPDKEASTLSYYNHLSRSQTGIVQA